MKRLALLLVATAATALFPAAPAAAQGKPARGETAAAADLAQFAPGDSTVKTKLDFSYWNTALNWFVLNMGMSTREYEMRPDAQVGTRNIYGHDSRYRLEGNRVAFSLLPADVKATLSEYRRDLEKLPDTVPLTRLSRNEQLAYWINLHNVAMIEQIALAYPVKSPADVRPNGGKTALDDAKFITVGGVALSPKDIRTRIVYPHWKDPRVVYAFWHGDIGGPSISRDAYTAVDLNEQLDFQALEFVNSLRGTQKTGSTLIVSRLYREARPFYFARWPDDIRAHLQTFAEDDVAKIIGTTKWVDARIEERDIADLSKGEAAPNYLTVESDGKIQGITDTAVARLITERKAKLDRYYKRYPERRGRVIVSPGDDVAQKEIS